MNTTEQTATATKDIGKCPRCDSPAPHLHPAVQFEGEVEMCSHDYHKIPTNQNGITEPEEKRIKGYRLERPDEGGTWMYCGSNLEEVINVVRTELEQNFEEDQHEPLLITPCMLTQEEIDNMPDFPGW